MKKWGLLSILLITGMTYSWAQPGLEWTESLSKIMKKESNSVQHFSIIANKDNVLYNAFPTLAFPESGPNFFEYNLDHTRDPLGIFCNLDLNLDQHLPFKLRFRLGEYHYTQELEYGIENFLSRSNEIK